MTLVVFLLGTIMSFLHYFSKSASARVKKYYTELIGFSSGLFITQIFIFLLPEFFSGKEFLGDTIFVLLVAGFTVFHIAEKYVYQHVSNKDKMLKDLAQIHVAGFFVDHFIVGMALAFAFQTSKTISAIAIYISLLLHTLSSSISLTHIDEYFNKNQTINILLSISPLIGIFAVTILHPGKEIYYAVYSVVIGAMLYVGIRDMMPSENNGKITWFLLGFIAMLALNYALSFS